MWPAHVINLAANTARMENSARELSRLGIAFERLDAVNGWAMDEGAVAAVYDAGENARRGKYPLVRPEIGCYLSHVEAWRRIAEGEAEGGFVFEDDIRAEDTLGEAMALLSGDEGRDWDMVKLFTFDTDPQVRGSRAPVALK